MNDTPEYVPGDRVVYLPWNYMRVGTGGTVIRVEPYDRMCNGRLLRTWYLHVILDTAEKVYDEVNQFTHEDAYNAPDYIPF